MKGVALNNKSPKGTAACHRVYDLGGGEGPGNGCMNEATNAVWGQMVKGLERFAIKFRHYPVRNGEPWEIFMGMSLFEKDNSASVEGDSSGGSPFGGTSAWNLYCFPALVFKVTKLD